MKVTVNSRTVFALPTRIVANRFTAGFIRKKLEKEGIRLTRRQTLLFVREMKKYKKKHAEWNLVEIEEKNGDTVSIRI